MKTKELTPEQIQLINRVFHDIMEGQATRTAINDAYYLICPDNVQEHHRMTTIVKWVEDHKNLM